MRFDRPRLIKIGLPLLYAGLLFIYLLRYYLGGRIISGGEGAYFLDFVTLLRNYAFSWLTVGTGIFATSLNFGYIFHLVLLQLITHNERITNFALIYLIYILPFLAMYLLLLEMKLKAFPAFLLSMFYIYNPFSAIFLHALNQWNVTVAYILPASLYLILKFYDDDLLLFLILGVHSFFFAFSNANPPTMILNQVALIVLVIFAVLYKEEQKWSITKIVKKYLIVLASFFAFNLWWILHWVYIFPDAQVGYTNQLALNWLKGIGDAVPVMSRTLNLEGMMPFPAFPEYDLFARYYTMFFSPLLLIIPTLVIFYLIFKNRISKRSHLFLLLASAIFIFLSKGTGGALGKVYELMVIHIPMFSIFKSANEKWGIIWIFLLTLLLTLLFETTSHFKWKRAVNILFAIYLIYILLPFLTGNIISDYRRGINFVGSRFFTDKKEYQDTRNLLNSDSQLYRVLSFSGSNNYQVALRLDSDKFYTGNDPILSNTNKPFLAPYNGSWTQRFGFLYTGIGDRNYISLLRLFNIGKIVINKDMYPWFGFANEESIDEIEVILNDKLQSKRGEAIDIYSLDGNFLPRFYIPTNIVHTEKKLDQIMDVLSDNKIDEKSRSAIFFAGTQTNISIDKRWITPKVTFVQINPAKYKISVENADFPYLLVFSESFHRGWKAYLDEDTTIPSYATGTSMKNYFNGQIFEVAKPYSFIDPYFSETWKKTALPENRHLLVNGYANSWLISPNDVGGRRNYELIIEFWPQRLFYIGIILSAGIFLIALVLLLVRQIVRCFNNSKKK